MKKVKEIITIAQKVIGMMKAETNSEQQSVAYKEYLIQRKEDKAMGFEILPFWEWYCFWCFENGLYNDRTSYQN